VTLGAAPFAGASSKGLSASQANSVSNGYVSHVTLDASLHASLPASIKSAGSITIAAQLGAAPYQYLSSAQKPMGFEVNLGDAIGKELGVKIKWVQFPQWNSIIPAVQTGRVNMSIAYMNDTSLREKTISFVDYLQSGIVMIVQAGNPEKISTPADLCGKTVEVQAASVQEIYLKSLNATGGACASKPITELVDQAEAQGRINLKTGRADAAFDNNISGGYGAAASGVAVVPYPVIEPGPYGFGFAKNSTSLMKAVQGAMVKLMAGGTSSVYQKIFTAWGVASAEIAKPTINGCASGSLYKGC
jgi:polar amino acid transport system substrate-binding protein